MLPLSRDEVCIALRPDSIVLARVSGRWRPRVIAKAIVPCADADTGGWKACIAALVRALADSRWHTADANVIISNRFVRYALAPWSAALASDDEKLAWVRHHFVEIYGEAVANSEYRWSEDGPDEACFASAIDVEFMEQLRRAFDGTTLKLRTIQPYFMTVFNRFGRRVAANALWILTPEPGHVCLAAIAQGKWQSITSRNIGADLQTDLQTILERELVIADATAMPGAVYAYVPQIPGFQLPHWHKVPLHTVAPRALPGFSPHTDADYAMALTGRV